MAVSTRAVVSGFYPLMVVEEASLLIDEPAQAVTVV